MRFTKIAAILAEQEHIMFQLDQDYRKINETFMSSLRGTVLMDSSGLEVSEILSITRIQLVKLRLAGGFTFIPGLLNTYLSSYEEIESMLAEALTQQQAYDEDTNTVLDILTSGGHYSSALPLGVAAIARGDSSLLTRLVGAAHDDTGLIEALQKATGKNLAYLAYEF